VSRKKSESETANPWTKKADEKQAPGVRSGQKHAAKKRRGKQAWDKTEQRSDRPKRQTSGKSPWDRVAKKDQQTWTGIVAAHPDGHRCTPWVC